MKQAMTYIGLAGACTACCAVPLLLPILGASAISAAWLNYELPLGLGALFVLSALAIGISRQRKAKLAASGTCGCSGKASAGR